MMVFRALDIRTAPAFNGDLIAAAGNIQFAATFNGFRLAVIKGRGFLLINGSGPFRAVMERTVAGDVIFLLFQNRCGAVAIKVILKIIIISRV